jgi:hypothetical protein
MGDWECERVSGNLPVSRPPTSGPGTLEAVLSLPGLMEAVGDLTLLRKKWFGGSRSKTKGKNGGDKRSRFGRELSEDACEKP